MFLRSLTRGLLGAVAVACLATQSADAGTTFRNLFYDNSAGQNNGGNIDVPTFTYFRSLTDADTGVEFDIEVLLTPSAGGTLRTNGGTTDREFGVRTAGNNPAIEPGESVTATLETVTLTNANGLNPADIDIAFDGFTDVIIYFSGNLGDAGKVTDGTTDLWSFEGSLDPAVNGGSPVTSDDSLFTFGVSGQSASSTGNARIDVSSFLPTTLVVEGVAHSNPPTGENNRLRVDDFGVQFTVTVTSSIPEPSTFVLMALGMVSMSAVALRRRLG